MADAATPAAPAPARVERSDPFVKRLLAYADERFPLGPVINFVVLPTVASTSLAASAALGVGATWDLGLVLLAVSYFLVIFLLRVLDEFKDYERDVKAYPERVLSRGVLTLDDMRSVAWALGIFAALCSAMLGLPALIACGVVLVYGLLMEREFFMGEWLGKDVFVYAVAHQPINLLFTTWLYVAYATRLEPAVQDLVVPVFGWWMLTLFLLGFGYEVSRKLWIPSEEQPGLVDSYSSHAVGPRGGALIGLLLLLGGICSAGWFAAQVGAPAWTQVFNLIAALCCLGSVGKFAVKPFAGASKPLQAAVGLGAWLVHIGLIAGLIFAKGWPRFLVWAGA